MVWRKTISTWAGLAAPGSFSCFPPAVFKSPGLYRHRVNKRSISHQNKAMLRPQPKQLRHDEFKLEVTHGQTMALPHHSDWTGGRASNSVRNCPQNEKYQSKEKWECFLQHKWEKKWVLLINPISELQSH